MYKMIAILKYLTKLSKTFMIEKHGNQQILSKKKVLNKNHLTL